MCESKRDDQTKRPKGLWAKFVEKLDKKLEAKAQSSCCKPTDKGKGPSCCS